jgi:HAE1 family hydrophobic/amphiphilic exporter-1
LKPKAQELGLDLRLAGELEEAGEESQSLLLVLILALGLIYMVMASQYEALLHPFVIMFTIPFSSIGVIWALILSKTHFSMIVLIGIITLAGIVVNNAIVLIDYINLLRRKGMGLYEAVQEAGRIRLRPILMTTLTTVLALVPMALGFGSGSEMQAPMARTIFGGLTVATMFTLIFIPVLYCVFERVKSWVMSKVATLRSSGEVEKVG